MGWRRGGCRLTGRFLTLEVVLLLFILCLYLYSWLGKAMLFGVGWEGFWVWVMGLVHQVLVPTGRKVFMGLLLNRGLLDKT